MSQAALAGLLEMSRTTIGQIENGTGQEIGVRKLIRILEVLGASSPCWCCRSWCETVTPI